MDKKLTNKIKRSDRWSWLFTSSHPIDVKIGQVWSNGKDSSPWENDLFYVEVLDVKDGWVRYRWINSTMWQDERYEVGMFCSLYSLTKKTKTMTDITKETMSNIYIKACDLGLFNERNQFNIRMNPRLIMSLEDNTNRLSNNVYRYGAGCCKLFPDSSVETYILEEGDSTQYE